jgi:hypothetical protein
MRHAATRAAAAAARRGAAAPGAAAEARTLATAAPAVAHPPQQSMRTAFTKDDPSHTAKWMQARRARRSPLRQPRLRSCSRSPRLRVALHGRLALSSRAAARAGARALAAGLDCRRPAAGGQL